MKAGTEPTVKRSTIHVCTTCRQAGEVANSDAPAGDDPGAPRAGAGFVEAVQRAAADNGIAVVPVRCLANCKRGLSAAIQAEGCWTYVFGDLAPADAMALVEGGRLLAGSTDGLMPWRGRPEPLKRGLIARIPPLAQPQPETHP